MRWRRWCRKATAAFAMIWEKGGERVKYAVSRITLDLQDTSSPTV